VLYSTAVIYLLEAHYKKYEHYLLVSRIGEVVSYTNIYSGLEQYIHVIVTRSKSTRYTCAIIY